MDPDVVVHRALSDETRIRLLRVLRGARRPLDARELARQVGLHLSTVRAHLDVLIGANLVDSHAEVRTTPGRPRRFYEATAEATDAAETGGYRLLAEIVVSHLSGTSADVRRDAIAAGRAWGTYFVERPPPYARMPRDHARTQVLLLLDRLGFQPELDDDGARILIRRCPFLDVARRHQDVVCSLHLGIMQGALETLGASVEARDLEPFVQPSLCVAHLTDIEDQR